MLTKLTIIIVINGFVIMVNFCNHFDKALTEIFQFCRALVQMGDPTITLSLSVGAKYNDDVVWNHITNGC